MGASEHGDNVPLYFLLCLECKGANREHSPNNLWLGLPCAPQNFCFDFSMFLPYSVTASIKTYPSTSAVMHPTLRCIQSIHFVYWASNLSSYSN